MITSTLTQLDVKGLPGLTGSGNKEFWANAGTAALVAGLTGGIYNETGASEAITTVATESGLTDELSQTISISIGTGLSRAASAIAVYENELASYKLQQQPQQYSLIPN